MAGAVRGDVIDLPMLAAHQRGPAVTVLSILMRVLARYAQVDAEDGASWAAAWDKLIGTDSGARSRDPDVSCKRDPWWRGRRSPPLVCRAAAWVVVPGGADLQVLSFSRLAPQ